MLLAGCGEVRFRFAGQICTATNGFGGYVKSLGEAQKSADKTIDVTYINQALQLFNVQEGRYPKNLQELVPNYVAKIPDAPIGSKIVYDRDCGNRKVVSSSREAVGNSFSEGKIFQHQHFFLEDQFDGIVLEPHIERRPVLLVIPQHPPVRGVDAADFQIRRQLNSRRRGFVIAGIDTIGRCK